MRILISASAAALALALTASASFAVPAFDEPDNSPQSAPAVEVSTLFDLGIDVTGVPTTATGVQSYLASVPAVTRSAILGGCTTYMEHPESARTPQTLTFCALAVQD